MHHRDMDNEGSAFFFFAAYRKAALVPANDSFGDEQPQTTSGRFTSELITNLGEFLKNQLLIFVGDTPSIVFNFNDGHRAVVFEAKDNHPIFFITEFDCIRYEVNDDLCQAVGMAQYDSGPDGNEEFLPDVAVLHEGLKPGKGMVHDFGQVERFEGPLVLSALDFFKVQYLIDQAGEAFTFTHNDGEEFLFLFFGQVGGLLYDLG